MTSPTRLRKGWCPGALRPMPAKDGLLLRLRVTAGRLSAATLRAVANAGRDYGNGRFELTSRGNLQMRGVSAGRLPRLLETLDSYGLLDTTAAGEAVRNVLVSPLSGLDGPDLGPRAHELEHALVADPSLHALPAKFGFLIDDGTALGLAAISADIRFVQTSPGLFAIALGGSETDAAFVGSCTEREIVATAVRLARAFLDFSARSSEEPRRMRDLLRRVAPETIAAAAGVSSAPRHISRPTAANELRPLGLLRLGNGGSCFGIGAAFGRLEASMLDKAAAAAEKFGTGEIRLTPWRALLLVGVGPTRDEELIAFFSAQGDFVTDTADLRLALAACGGLSACASATTNTGADALSLAGLARRLVPIGVALHVSGCAKGCARSVATPLVLVAREGRYDLVLNGTAGGLPSARGLDVAQVSDRLEQMAQERRVIS